MYLSVLDGGSKASVRYYFSQSIALIAGKNDDKNYVPIQTGERVLVLPEIPIKITLPKAQSAKLFFGEPDGYPFKMKIIAN